MNVPVPSWLDSPQKLSEAIERVAIGIRGNHVASALDAYIVLGYWYALAKDDVRRLARASNEYKAAKRNEDILEGFVKAGAELINALKHLDRKELNG